MSGFKNVLFGGEGLYVTTVTGPGIVWLQGMPPNRMVSEIVRRLPSRRGHDLGIPIDMGGGGTNSQDDSMDERDDSLDNDDSADTTDVAIDTHRRTEVISSSSGEDYADPESSKSLFGDASFEDRHIVTENTINDIDDDFGDATKFSAENDSANMDENNMFDDFSKDNETSFTSNDEFSTTDEFFSDDNHSASDTSNHDEGINSLLGKIWDIFNNDD